MEITWIVINSRQFSDGILFTVLLMKLVDGTIKRGASLRSKTESSNDVSTTIENGHKHEDECCIETLIRNLERH